MEIFPAIDLRFGNAVRLSQGDYDKMNVYSSDPVAVSQAFLREGAKNLHVVDLDGAKDGALSNYTVIEEIAENSSLFIEAGGGIRTEQRIVRYLEAGVSRVILGTAAINDFPFLTEMVKRYGGKIAVGVDAKNGTVAVDGWLRETDVESIAFCRRVRDIGVQTVIYTDIAKDGMLAGTNLTVYEQLTKIEELKIIASGGVSYLEEITALRQMGIHGVIVGKAIYEKKLSLKEILAYADGGKNAG